MLARALFFPWLPGEGVDLSPKYLGRGKKKKKRAVDRWLVFFFFLVVWLPTERQDFRESERAVLYSLPRIDVYTMLLLYCVRR